MKAKLFTFALASLLLTGCLDEKATLLNYKATLEKSIPKEEDAQARHFIELVRTGHYLEAQLMVPLDQWSDQASRALEKLHELLNQGEPLEIVTIGYNTTVFRSLTAETHKTDLSYQIHFKHAWVVGDVLLDQKTDATYVLGVHFHQVRDSLEILNRFTFSGRSPLHYAVLVFSVLIPAFILYALVVCIRSPIRRKWLWILFILFGLIEFRFDWTTGLHDIQPLTVLLFGVGVVQASPYSPWVFELGLPVGALVFLLRRRKLTSPKPPIRQPAA